MHPNFFVFAWRQIKNKIGLVANVKISKNQKERRMRQREKRRKKERKKERERKKKKERKLKKQDWFGCKCENK